MNATSKRKSLLDNRRRLLCSRSSFAIGAILLAVVQWCTAGPAYPLKISPGQHYAVDQNGSPFFIQGDSPWFLTEALRAPDVDYYLSNRWVQGYNSIILDLAAQQNDDFQAYSGNIYGQLPFTNTMPGPYTNLLSWNLNYFTNVDAVIQRAGYYGINVFAYPLYDSYSGTSWYLQMLGNSSNGIWSYGNFIGNRYKNFTNLVWIGAGDYSEPGAPNNCLWNIVAAGITSADTNHLITAQAARPTPAIYYSAFVTLNCTYVSQFPYVESLANYQRTPTLASFSREPYYEYRNITGTPYTALDCRHFAYWALFSGDMGHFFGNEHQWPFAAGWQAEMWDTAATTITNVFKLMRTRPWWNCVPDSNNTTLTGGYGTYRTGNYVVCTRDAGGKTALIYIPVGSVSPTVDLSRISGTNINAWWYDPQTGAATSIGSFPASGKQSFTPPDGNDWVLVLDDASQNFGSPGNAGPVANNQHATTTENTPVSIVLTGNDPQGLSLNYVVVAMPLYGLLTGTPPNLTYTPFLNYVGPDTFTFLVNNGNLASSIAVVSVDVTATGPVNPAVIWTNPADVVYGTTLSSQQLDATANVPGAFTYKPAEGTVLSAGSNQVLTVTFTPTDTTNYNSLVTNVILNVLQASLTITASNQVMTYGASVPTVTAGYDGFVNGDTAASLTKQPIVSTTATAGSNVGTYPITVSGAASGNYNITYVNGTLMVSPAPLTITAANQTKFYGAAVPVLTASFSGFVNGDTVTNLLTAAILTTTATSTSPVGTYPVLVSGATSLNYSITFIPGTLTVVAQPALIGQVIGNGQFRLTSAGPPGQVYAFQYATNCIGPWKSIGVVTADSSGALYFDAPAATSPGFYRSAFP